MNAHQTIILARKHLGTGVMDSSARLCLTDALRLHEEGHLTRAKERALKSIAYSVGILHADYKNALKPCSYYSL